MSRIAFIIVTFFALLLHNLQAQELRVTSFIVDDGDITARTAEGRKLDAIGNLCALVKVHLLEAGAKFSSSDLVEASDLKVNQYWVYMARGAKMLDINVPGHHTLSVRFSDHNAQIPSLNRETTYHLYIDTGTAAASPHNTEHQVNQPEESVEVDITLNVSEQAEIWVNRMNIGKSSWSGRLSTGTYPVETRLPNRPAKRQTITITANGPRTFQLEVPDHNQESLAVDKEPVIEKAQPEQKAIESISNPVKKPARPIKTEGYIGAAFQAGGVMGPGIQAGAYINNYNIEALLTFGMNKSDEIAWKQTAQPSNSGYTYTYSAMQYGLKAGYGIDLGSNFRLTPQVGIGIASISGSQTEKGKGTDPDATACYALPAAVSARIDYKPTPLFGINLTPEFSFAMSESETFQKLAEFSSQVKGFGSGFNIRIGVAYCF